MLQDGIVTKYLNDHCGKEQLKLCPYRNELPATADDFLWGNSMFNTLGRFQGMDDEMGHIVVRLAERLSALAGGGGAESDRRSNSLDVATGEGTIGWLPHTYGIIEHYIPSQSKSMRAAHQQHWDINFAAVNRLHVPVALGSMLLVFLIFARACGGGSSTTSRCLRRPCRLRCSAMR